MPKTQPAPKERPPIVVVMGHVDHGKTTLLDTLRRSYTVSSSAKRIKEITAGESGGITQHIGAYEIEKESRKVTFIDTPGHEAFSAMRERGSSIADIALLIVAADDGVKPQTKEVIKHIEKASIPFIVVINKTDRPGADVNRVKNELAAESVLVEGLGGKVPVVEVSAKSGEHIDELLDTILLVAELEELTYDAVAHADGYVLESHLDPKKGIVTSLIVTNGTLRTGDELVCGSAYGRVKIMMDHLGRTVKGAVPSMPVSVIGMNGAAVAGDPCLVVDAEVEAASLAREHEAISTTRREGLLLETAGQPHTLPLVVKADVQGSLEAVIGALREIKSEQVGLKIVRAESGVVSEGDAKLAGSTGAIIVAFRTPTSREARAYAEQKGISIHAKDVIYELVETVREEMGKQLEPTTEREELGRLNILAIFRTESRRMIVGGRVETGTLEKGVRVDVEREGERIGSGKIISLKIGESEKNTVSQSSEVGVLFEGEVRIKEGDTLIAFKEETRYPTL